MKLLTFHNQKHIKDRVLAQFRSHYEADTSYSAASAYAHSADANER